MRLLVLAAMLAVAGCGGAALAVRPPIVTFEAGALIVSFELSAPGYARVDVWDEATPALIRRGAVRPTPGLYYRETVTGLTPGGAYRYQIVAGPMASLDADAVRLDPVAVKVPPEIRISNVAVAATAQGARVTWETNRATDSAVMYGRAGELEARRTVPEACTRHALELTGLEAGREYELVVIATDVAGEAPVTRGVPVTFITPRLAGEATRIMPRQGPRTNTLADLSRDYLSRLRSLSATEKKKLEDQIRAHSPEERIELSPAERAELTARPTDPADAAAFERRVDLVQRWIIHLGIQGRDIGSFDRAAVTLSNRFFVAPGPAAAELDRTVKALADLD